MEGRRFRHGVRTVGLSGLLLAALPCAWAVNPEIPISQLSRDSWGLREGLPQLSIPSITQTRSGYLWVGTVDGLLRFDGLRFTPVSSEFEGDVPSSSIPCLLEDRRGTLWVGSDKGLYSLSGGKSTAARLTNKKMIIWALAEAADGTLWAGTDAGLFRKSGERWDRLTTANGLPDDKIHSIASEPDGAIWLATSKGVARYDGKKFQVFRDGDGLTSNLINSVVRTSDGAVWVGAEGGLSVYRDGRMTSLEIHDNQLLPGRVRTSGLNKVHLMQDSVGALWIGTGDHGVGRYYKGRLEWLSKAGQLPTNSIGNVFEDSEHDIWLGSRDAGLIRLRDPSFLKYSVPDEIRGTLIFSILPGSEGDLWIGTDEGVSRLTRGAIQNDVFPARLGLKNVYTLARTKSNFWFGIRGDGLRFWDGVRVQSFTKANGLGDNYVWALAAGSDDTLWAATSGGLSRIRNKQVKNFSTADGLPQAFVSSVIEASDKTLWVGTWGGGICRWIDDRAACPPARDDRLKMIRVIFEGQNGRIWVGAQDGLGLVDSGVVKSVAAASPLLAGTIRSISEDQDGNLWLNTTKGVVSVKTAELLEFVAGKRTKLASVQPLGGGQELASLLQTAAAPQPSGVPMQDGKIWFLARESIIGVNPSAVPRNAAPPPVLVEAIRVNGIRQPVAASLKVGPGVDQIEFDYTSLSLKSSERNHFRYRLAGFDDQWVDALDRRAAFFTRVPPGDYKFELIGSNNNGVWGTAQPIAISVTPFFYQSRWFAALVSVMLVTLGIAAYQLRIRRLKQKFALVLEERERIARELHDTMVQGYVGIASQLDAVTQELQTSPVLASMHLDMARKMAHHSMTEARRAVSELRSQDEGEAGFRDAVGRAMEPLEQQYAIPIRKEIDAKLPQLRRDAQLALIRIAQEAVTNSLKHSGAGEVYVTAAMVDQTFVLSVKDNGKGFDSARSFSALDGHFGLLGMKERAQAMGALLEVKSNPGGGAAVVVSAPVRAVRA